MIVALGAWFQDPLKPPETPVAYSVTVHGVARMASAVAAASSILCGDLIANFLVVDLNAVGRHADRLCCIFHRIR